MRRTSCVVAAALTMVLVACQPKTADLDVAIAPSTAQAVVGQAVTYTSTVVNNGRGASNGATFEQVLPSGIAFVSATPSKGTCAHAGGTVDCNLGGVLVNETVTVTVTGTAVQAGPTTSTVTAVDAAATTPTQASAEAVVNVLAEAPTGVLDDTFTRADADSLGDAETGQGWQTTTGSWRIQNQRATPAASGYVFASADGGGAIGTLSADVPQISGEFWLVLRASDTHNYWRFGRSGGGGNYQLVGVQNDGPGPVASTLAAVQPAAGDHLHCVLQANSITCGVNGVPVATTNSNFNHVATGFGFAAFHPNQISPVAFDDLEFAHPDPLPLLTLAMTSSAPSVNVGDPISYQLSVGNAGDSASTAVRVEDTLPTNFALASVTPSQGACVPSASTFTCELGGLDAAESATVAVTGTATAAGLATNTASVFHDAALPELHDTASASVSVLPPAAASPLIDTFTRVDGSTLGAADTGQTWAALSGSWGVTGERAAPTSSGYSLALVPAGATAGTVEATVPALSGEYWLVVRASTSENYWRFGRAGGDYVLQRVAGNGLVPTDATVLTTATPAAGDVLACTTSASTLTCSVNGTPLVTTANTFNNTAGLVGLASFGAPTVRFDDVSFVEPTPAPLLVVGIAPSADPVVIGETLGYNIDVDNTGSAAANAVRVDSTLPSQVSIDSVTPSQGTCSVDGNEVTCALGGLAAGASASIAIDTTTVDDGVATADVSVFHDVPPAELHDAASSTVLVLPEDIGDEVLDTFSRPNQALLGIADTGHPWAQDLGAWAVVDGSAVHTSTGYGMATVDAGAAFGYYDVVVADPSDEFWVIFHQTDADNYWRFGRLPGGNYVLHRIENGQLGTGGFHLTFGTATPAPNDFIRIRLKSDDSIDVYVNGQRIVGTGSFFNIDATRYGFTSYRGTASSPTPRFDLVRFTPFSEDFPEPPHD